MSEVFILKNQFDLFLDKHGQWVDQADPTSLYRTAHKDEAINVMVEHTVKNPDLRIKVATCGLNERGQLVLSPSADPTEMGTPLSESIDPPAGDSFAKCDEFEEALPEEEPGVQ